MVALARGSWLKLALGFTTLSSAVFAASDCDKKFEFTLTVGKWAPDGVERDMVLVNGAFPAPTIEVNQGDQVEVVIHNKMVANTTVHFHGTYSPVRPRRGGRD
jgi:FtsP/CotA-like multicopper oxidase with cupredoxin domain